MKNFLWILFTTGLLLFSCSSSENITSNDENVRLPGMPADEGSAAIIEADGLIGVEPGAQYTEFFLLDSIRVVVDDPYDTEGILDSPLNLIIYALPNGNSIEWTMGKQKNAVDNWHFNIQYVDAQAEWLRQHTSDRYVVAYLEAPKLSWPAWKKSHPDHGEMISHMFDSLRAMYPHARVLLNSHSGGGSLINGFIETRDALPAWVKRISFIDSNYGYSAGIGKKLESWLDSDPAKHLSVFAYNDSVALYEGKPFVSATGGTWYRTGMMINDLGEGRKLVNTDLHKGIIQYRSTDEQILILRKQNPEREIFHTEQVELNGFIHSVLFGTGFESQGYEYFGEHAYEVYIKSDTVKF